MKKIKILRVIARLNIGGPARNAVLLTEGLDKDRFDTLLVCGNINKYEGDMLYYANEKNIEPYFIPELKRELNFFNDLMAFKKIYNVIKVLKPDIIHTHTAKAGALGRLAGILCNLFSPNGKRAKLIHTFHGHVLSGYFDKFKTKLFILIERFLAIFTDKIITVSESVKEELVSLRISKEDKIAVIPLGFELDKLLGIPIRDNAVSDIGIVGRLAPIKNHRLFLKAIAEVMGTLPQVKLRFKIIGDGELRQELEEYSRQLNINTQVVFLGWQEDLISVYSDLDIVALTSINEGTPVSLIEAMAAGRAIVATDVGGVRDLLGARANDTMRPNAGFRVLDKGIIVAPEDPASFAKALIYILRNNELRKSLGVLARNFVKIKFAKDRLIKDIERLYDGMLNNTTKTLCYNE